MSIFLHGGLQGKKIWFTESATKSNVLEYQRNDRYGSPSNDVLTELGILLKPELIYSVGLLIKQVQREGLPRAIIIRDPYICRAAGG